MHFGLRGHQEHVQLMWGDVQLETSANGEFLEFNERTTKTRQGTTRNNVRPFHPKMFATGLLQNTSACNVTLDGHAK